MNRRSDPVDGMAWCFAIGSVAVVGPFLVAVSLFGCAAVVKAARLLYDVAVSWGAA